MDFLANPLQILASLKVNQTLYATLVDLIGIYSITYELLHAEPEYNQASRTNS